YFMTTLILLSLIILPINIDAASSWSKHGSKQGVTLFVQDFPKSDVPKVRAITIINSPTDNVWNFITGPGMKNKIKGVKDSKHLGSCGENCDYIYVRLGNWMIADRQYVVKMKWSEKDVNGSHRYIRYWKKTNEISLPNKNAMNVNSINGSWLLEPMDGGKKTRLTYENHLDLGGSVPAHLFTSGFINKAYELMVMLKSEAR
ncbi:MAG: hypothetical protein JXR91_04220, partial [Deltaproteobacteria bacterium]|nr:hypothetical protein [Deltaproteobacteria bacterium]